MEVQKKEEDTPSTKGKSLFSLLLQPRSSMDSTTKAQSLQNKASVPSFYQGRLHKNHYENQAIVPLPTQHLAHSYTASLSVVKVNTIPLIASYKTKILIFLAGKPQKKERRGLQKPPVSYQWTPTVRRVSSSQTLTAELKISTRKKVFMHKISQNIKYLGKKISTNKDNKMIYTPPAASEFELQIPEAEKQIKTPKQ